MQRSQSYPKQGFPKTRPTCHTIAWGQLYFTQSALALNKMFYCNGLLEVRWEMVCAYSIAGSTNNLAVCLSYFQDSWQLFFNILKLKSFKYS